MLRSEDGRKRTLVTVASSGYFSRRVRQIKGEMGWKTFICFFFSHPFVHCWNDRWRIAECNTYRILIINIKSGRLITEICLTLEIRITNAVCTPVYLAVLTIQNRSSLKQTSFLGTHQQLP